MNSAANTSPNRKSKAPGDIGRHRLSFLWPLILIAIYLALNLVVLVHTTRTPGLADKMQAKDSRQYVKIAEQFASGDFSMSYVKEMPHRQPLYSLLLAPVIKVWGTDLLKEGFVNVAVGLVLLLCLYYGILRLFGSVIVAFVTGLLFIGNPFMVDKISCRLMTEPLHALWLTVLILFFLAYLRTGRMVHLLAAAGAAGMDYLARTNGLFVMAAMACTLLGNDLWKLVRRRSDEGKSLPGRLGALVLGYGGAVLVFVIITTPSWLPRYAYFHDPIHHGYLSNFMFVDTYEQGHTGQAHSDFTWKDYAKSHDFHAFAQRWAEGFYSVYYDIPRHAERVRVLYLLAALGIGATIVKRRREYGLLLLFMFVQLLPVVWTSITAPGPRIAYGTLFPFELFFAALFLSYLVPQITQRVGGWTRKESRTH